MHHHLGGWGVTASWEVTKVEPPRPGYMEVIWMTALSSELTSRYLRPTGGAGIDNPSFAASISPFPIAARCITHKTSDGAHAEALLVAMDLNPRPAERGEQAWTARVAAGRLLTEESSAIFELGTRQIFFLRTWQLMLGRREGLLPHEGPCLAR
jgi:hypothetical protein